MPVIGIDIGTQSLKAVVVDSDLVLRGEASVPYQPYFPAPGWAEQDPALWLRALKPAIAGAIAASGLAPADIKGIAVSGQLDGCVPVGTDGNALAPCVIWMDRRAVTEVVGIDPDMIRERTGLVLDATHMAAKIRWMRRHVVEAQKAAIWHQPVSFVVAALCGRSVMDHALASTTMLYGLDERAYADDLLALFDIDRGSLPEIGDATATAGTLGRAGADLTGLPAGTPVAVGTGDDFANPIGAGIVAPGTVACSLGTAEVVGAVSDSLRIDEQSLVETHGFLGNRFLVSNPGWLSGGAVTWFLSTFGVSTPGELSALAGQVPAGCDGLTFLPALSGAMAPRWEPGARGAFYGLTAAHGKAACARALLEGCAFAMRDVVDRMQAMDIDTGRIRLCGGGARSRVWAQMRADLCQRPVEIAKVTDASPLGAALLACVAARAADSIDEAVSRMPLRVTAIDPDPAKAEKYETAYRRYRTLFDALVPLYAG
ncbi:FGGY family carbohydrate kinase [Mesorhizobium sp. KR9-304]|uniref:xylulokinase n=1 Tax=Mesorhizobium sp. KR9-304 TaxID=3156614 RepID=UPI0032B5A5B0